jgi:rubrerythrin
MVAWSVLACLAIVVGSADGVAVTRQGEDALKSSLDRALDDERRAIAFYDAVLERHGERMPFSNIIEAERRHAGALMRQYERLGLEPPADRWSDHPFRVPDSFAEACDMSVVAEIRNVRMYDELIARVDDQQVVDVFDRLRTASQDRHLPAFERHSSGWERVSQEDLTEEQATQMRLATGAQKELSNALLREVMGAVMKNGPTSAIEVCSERAPVIASEVGAAQGVRIGRTSFRLRNPSNDAPVWADIEIESKPETERVFRDESGRLGALMPIRMASFCVQCHGPEERLAPGVGDTLERLYPDDRATGFNRGDLRGWFWVEVPAASGGE